MNLAELVALLNDRSIALSARNGELLVHGKKQALNEDGLLELLREHKAALIDLIESGTYVGPRSAAVDVPPNLIPGDCTRIEPAMLTLVQLGPEEIARIVDAVPGGAPNIQDIYPLAPLQEGILFHHLMARAGDPYLLHALYSFDNRSRLESYLQALQSVIDRHDILRTAVMWEGLAEPVQVVLRAARLQVEEVSLDPAQGDIAGQLRARFDPRRGRLDVREAPLLRVFIAEDPANARWVMVLLFHHLVSDHTTLEMMQQEVQAHLLGQAEKLPVPLPFRNFVAQARLGVKREEHEAYFRKLLGDVEEPTAPFGLTDVQGEGSGITEAQRALEPQLARRLRERARALGVSAASLFHLAYAQVLSRVSGRDDVVFGTVLFGRMQGGEGAERVLGLFINTLPVRIRLGEAGVEEAVKSTHAQLAQLLRHEHASLALAQRCSAVAAPAPLFSSLLNYRHYTAGTRVSAEARRAWEGMRSLGGEERTNYPLVLSVEDLGEALGLTAQARSPIDPARVCGYMQRALEELVAALEKAPATPLRSLDILPAPERHQLLLEWNDTKADYPAARCVHEWVEEVARTQPKALAVQCGAAALSYGELEARAEALAARLRERGAGTGALVAVYLERSVEMVVALLAAWKAGAAYVPIDPQYPPERVRFMLEDTGAPVVVTQESLAGGLPASGAAVLRVDEKRAAGRARGTGRGPKRAAARSPDQLAYVIFTSGSTGQPKGVQITHASLCNLIHWHQRAYGLTPADRATQLAGPAFDASVWELWPYLTAGASVHLPDEATRLDPAALVRWLVGERITVSFLPTPLAEAALRESWPQKTALRVLLTGGDRLNQRPAQALPFRLVNHYGPTENTVVSTCAEVEAGGAGAPPIGRPLPNTRAYVVDAHLNPVPVGVPGELLVGGVQLAGGYWKRPELTQEKFIADPFERASRLYRTGDLVRYTPEGNIEFLGRVDTQVKVRGFRIELGEIESALGHHPAVREAVVVAREDSPGDKRLVAYVVASGEAPAVTELKEHLASRLPSYMVPAAFVVLEALPLTPNGKVDRKALPAPEYTGLEAEYVAPRNATEEKLAQIWAEVLKVERVGIHDNFFELGGHSLLAVTLIERMRRAGLHADVRALFTTSTLAELAAAVGGESGIVEVPPNRILPQCEAITPEMLPLISLTPDEIARIVAQVPGGAANIQDIYPLAPLQEGILFHHLMAREGDPYLLHSSLAFDSRSRLEHYVEALQSVIDRHDILRTGVLWEGLAEPVQVVWRKAQLKVEEVSLDPARGDVAQQLRVRYDPHRYRIDVRETPLLRIFIAEDRANARWVMLQLFHHLAIDHTAVEVMHHEVQAYLLGQASKLPAPLPFRNFVAQARLGVKREEHEAYFKELLGDVEEPTAPFGLVDVQGDGSGITEARQAVEPQLAKRLRERARALGVSAASLCHLAYAQVLARTAGRDDVVFGTVLFGRMQGGEGAERVLGLFINTLPVRIRVGEAGVEEAVKSTHAQLAQLLRHEHASLALAQRASRVAAPAPLFSALLNYRHNTAGTRVSTEARRAWEGVRSLGGEERTNYPLVLSVDDLGEGFGLKAQVQSPIDPARICGYMQRALEELVVALERSPTAPLRRLDILPAPERRQLLVEWNDTKTDYPGEASIAELFEAQAKRTPEAVALEYEGEELTYKELNGRANRLAHYLKKQGVGRETMVGLCVERSLEMVVATLAILKAGGAYVPLDPEYPGTRLAFMLEDTGAPVLLTQERLRERLPAYAGKVIELDSDWKKIARESAKNPKAQASAQSLAYVIYTSGSTGRPKGTAVEQGSIARLVKNTNYIELTPAEVFLQFAPISFDASTLEIWGPLLNGGRLVVAPAGRLALEEVAALIKERGITTLWLTAALFHQMVDSQPGALRGVRQLLAGGEALSVAHVRKFLEGIGKNRLINGYGPTENTTFTCCHVMTAETRIEHTVPIGRPISNTRVYILDSHLQPAPVGVVGELYAGGAGLARGYLNQPQLTEEKFVPDPFHPGERLYRTGDLVRYTSEGLIEFQGRIDGQVKVRGYRIELGEIEAVLGSHPAVKETVVLAREDSPGDKRLVAYVVGKGEAPAASELKEHLASRLPPYMVPAAFVTLEALPLTENGKVDRRALPAPERTGLEAEYVAPRNATEEKLAQIWAEVLKVERVSIHDNFFELGGHSLLAVTLIERMRRAGLHADVRALFTTSTLAELALAVGGESGEVEVPPNRIPAGCEAITPEMLPLVSLTPEEIARIAAQVPGGARNVQDIYPLAPLQEGILFHHLMARAGDPYLLYGLAGFDSRARLDSYLQALQSVIDRHDILRTAVLWEGLAEPVQVVCRSAPLKVEEVHLDSAQGDIAQQLRARFDPRRHRIDVREAPLLKIFIAEDRANGRWVMLRLFHHLAIDHTASDVVQQEVRAYLLGQADKLPVPLPFRNFVAQARLGVPREEHEAYFKQLLGDVDEPTAPFGLADVQGEGTGITEARQAVEPQLAKRLRERARSLGVSAASLCHLAYAQVLSRTAGRDDVVFGTVLFGRMQGGEGAERVLGLFINTLPVRIRVGAEGVEESVRATHAQLAQLLRHEHASLALAQRCSAVAAPAPLFSALLNYRHIAVATHVSAEARRAGEGIRHLGGEERTNYPLVVSVDDFGEGLGLTAKVQSPLDPQRICGYMQRALEELVAALERSPATPLHSLEVLPEPERRQLLVEWNDTKADYPGADALMHELFEAQAARTPQAVALEFEGRELTYKELNARANRLARVLRRKGVAPDALVGVYAERSFEMVVALLAILKAGGAYVPLDPSYPAERLAHMLEDARVSLVLAQSSLASQLPAGAGERLVLDSAAYASEPGGNLEKVGTAQSLAYVIFTSGSTGRPKGAMNEHRGIVNRLLDMQAQYRLTADDVLLQKTPYSFDVSVWEFFWPLITGARLVIARPEGHRDSAYLAQLIRERGVTTAHFVPSMLRVFLQERGVEACRSFKRVYSGGEALTRELQELFFARLPGAELHNLYGPAEAAVDVTAWACRRGDTQLTVPIGHPLANTTAYVLDSRLRPVPAGVAGELHIGGVQVGRGYVGRPDLTAERFVPDPFSKTPGARLYKTGDLARHLADGAIEYLGRTDFQVKIRGQRIELGEIEAVLDRHPGVAQSVAVAREDTPGDQRLVAYVVAQGEAPAAVELKEHLARELPPYMVPTAFVVLEAFPLTSSGKVDRKALPAPDGAAYATRGYEAPEGEVEERLAGIWAEVLKLERVGRHDNFFELGGHSLLAITLIERMRRAGLNADVRVLFTTPTLAELAQAVGGESGEVEVPPNRIPAQCEAITPEMLPLVTLTPDEIERIVDAVPGGAPNIQDIYPLAPLQEGILFHHLMAREGDPYLLRALYSFDNRGRLERYLEALQSVIDRHDILRTAVMWEGLAEPVQVVWRKARLKVEELGLDATSEGVARQLAARFDPRRYRIDIGEAPLLRIFFAEDRANARWVMLLLLHHLVSDHTALEGVQKEVQAYLLDQAAQLPVPLPFRNFVAQARLGVPREEHETYFKNLLGDVEEPTAPFGLVDVQGDGSGITEARQAVEPQLAKRLRERSRALGVSAASLCHLAYAQVLARTSGREDVVFGTVLFGRMQGGEGAERVLGLFINTLPVRIRVGGAGVEESVRSTHAQLAQLLRHEHASLALAQRCSAVAAPAPLFSSFLNYRHIASAPQARTAQERQAWEGIRYLGGEERTNYPLVLAVDDLGEGLGLRAQAQSPVDPQRVCAYMHRALEELVSALESAPIAPLRSLDVLPDEERRRLLEEWNGTHVEYPADASLHSLFEAQVRRTPDAVAVVFEDECLSFRDLDARANRLARHLGKQGVGRDTPVALCAERSLEMVVGMLGILKAGGAYVPIDPDLPQERTAYMLDETQSPVVLIQQRLRSRIPPVPSRTTVCLDSDWSAIAREAATPVSGEATATDIAYVIYTSGSTGRPKGVMVPHSAICNHMLWMQRVHPLGQADAVLQKTPFGFDASVWEFFAPLLAGARLVMARPGGHLDPDYLVRTILAQKVSTLQLVPSQLRMLLAEPGFSRCAPPLRHVYCGGEPLTRDLCDAVRAKLPQARLHNLYGPTEATIDATSWDCPADEAPAVIPIGTPIDNVRAYVVSPQMQLSPVGVPGELLIGGAGLARGYLKQLELTAERFVPDPFSKTPGARLYKTGDLARHLADGAIEYLGRVDFQVKIRGFRIELGEIEAVLDQHPGVAQSVVVAREDTPGDQRLVAYVVAKGEAPAAAELKEHLSSQLPQYMVPSAFVTLEALPLTSSGKVDRKALPAPERTGLEAEYVAPRNATEEKLAEIWAQVLKLEQVGIHDNFFELGGHSLLAITLIERMRRAGLNAEVRALFATPTIAELAQALGGESGAVEVPPNRIPAGCEAITPEMLPLIGLTADEIARIVAKVPGGAANIQDVYPLAPLQEGILFHHLMARAGDPYLLRALYSFESRARLDGYLEALQAVIDRHDILRTAVLWEGLSEPVQVVWRKARLKVEELSLDATSEGVARQLAARFDPRRYRLDIGEAPLLRIFVAEDRTNARWVVLLLFHHLAIDHTALAVMQQEVQAHMLGQAEKLSAPPPFRNFVAQARLGVPRAEHEAYFKQLLGDVDEPTAPFGLMDVQGDGTGIAEAHRAVDAQLAKRLRERARALGVSAASLCHLAYAQVLSRTSGRDDVVFGTVLFGRMQGGEGAERVLGLFINTLPVRIRVGEAGAEESVRNTHAQVARLLRHEHASLALAQRASRVAAPAPLFSSLLNYRHSAAAAQTPTAEALRAWEGVRSLGGEERTNYPLVVSVDDLGEGFGLKAQAQPPIDPSRVCGYMHNALEQLVVALESSPTAPLARLDVLPAPERRQLLVEWNATQADYARESGIAELFEAQAKRTPEAVALEYEGEELSYKELNSRANRLAHYLAKQGVTHETRVGLCVERSLEMVVGTLGILKAGGAYVPLDPEYPGTRLAFMLEDTGAPVLLTQSGLRERLPAYAGKVIELDSDWKKIARESAQNPKGQASAGSLAYVIYTSGSTGRPKGTLIEQRSVVRLVSNTNYVELGPEEVFLQFAPISFDASTLELWGPLLNGGRLVIAPAGRVSLEELAQLIKARGVTTLWLTAALFHQMVDSHPEALKGVRQLLAGGEALSVAHVRRFLEAIGTHRLINGYGPTENTTFSCCHVMGADSRIGSTVPIGRPIANSTAYVLDGQRQPVPVGVMGELYVGGAGLARGYLNQPELTAEKFVPDPFHAGQRLYRTGDLVRYTPEGLIEFQGRIDTQVKVRGYRVELGEIEAVLGSHPGVREVVVLAREDTPGDKRLVAYVVGEASAAELKEHLAARLPSYMLPTAFVVLEQLPLTPNGKVDRKALPAPERTGLEAEYVAPRTPTEESLAAIWAEVLKVARVGIHDNFFELGGHSLLATQVVSRINQKFNLSIPLRVIFEESTLAGIASYIEMLVLSRKVDQESGDQGETERIRI